MKGNIAAMMQQAQRMQENVKRAQEELASVEVTGNAGGGMVGITLTCRMEARKVRIDPSALADAEMLEDLIAAAFNDAVNKANAESEKRMAAIMPPGMKLPF
jgi:DNA-binding YbaB/EbfC family protein